MANTSTLEAVEKGRFISSRGLEWCVIDKTVSKESDSYLERQWTLTHGYEEAYLVKSEEKKAGGLEEIWVLTRKTNLGAITYEASPGNWRSFDEDSMPDDAPRVVRAPQGDFSFDGQSSVRAEDDDGNMVPKITWDFYSPDRSKNLAIEIWKEDDKDYPEAYLGNVVSPSDFEILNKKAAAGSLRKPGTGPYEELKTVFTGFGLFGFIAIINGLPMDYYVTVGVPGMMLGLMKLQGVPAWLTVSSVCVWVAVAAAAKLGGFGLSFWYLTGCCAALATALPRLMRVFFPGEDISGHWRVGAFGVLPALWLYSFIEYLVYAPGPHAAYQFLSACLLPLAASAAAMGLARALEGSDVRS